MKKVTLEKSRKLLESDVPWRVYVCNFDKNGTEPLWTQEYTSGNSNSDVPIIFYMNDPITKMWVSESGRINIVVRHEI